jgi:hypothetical protein
LMIPSRAPDKARHQESPCREGYARCPAGKSPRVWFS